MSEDTISRKTAIDAMEDVDWYHINKDGQLTHGANSKEDEPLYKAEDVYKVLNDMPSAQQRWIPCSERLPDEEVLCCDTRGEMIIGYPYPDEESNTGFSANSDDVFMIDCAAWMPLPEPYEERRTDD